MATYAIADAPKQQVDIAAGDLASALLELSNKYGVDLVYRPDQVRGLKTRGAHGRLTNEEAVDQLLEGTALKLSTGSNGSMLIAAAQAAPGTSSKIQGADSEAKEGKAPSSQGFRMAQVDQAPAGSQVEQQRPGSSDSVQLEEVIVTAQKREERQIDTPASVTAINADQLSSLGITQLRDFADTVPGMSVNTGGAGLTQITLRGVTTGEDISSTTAIYVDEVPYGSSSPFGGSTFYTLDADLFDLDRIEVLRGPQGTLYGASSMGGLVKYVTKPPDVTAISGVVQTGASTTVSGAPSYNFNGALNAPLIPDKLAVRATAFESHDGGYVDNLQLGQTDVNRSKTYGGRLDLLALPTEALSIRLSGMLQSLNRDGYGLADYNLSGVPIDGPLDKRRFATEPFYQHYGLLSATVRYTMGWAGLTSVSAYQTSKNRNVSDETALYQGLLSQAYGRDYGSIAGDTHLGFEKFTQEIRLASPEDANLQWVLGAFYSHVSEYLASGFLLRAPTGQAAVNDVYGLYEPSHTDELAGFADLTYRITRQLDVTGGVRYARDTVANEVNGAGLLGSSVPFTTSMTHVLTYLANARYHFGHDQMVYFRFATGYRPGGPNVVFHDPNTGAPMSPATFQSDSLKSYEVGYKSEFADRRFGVDLAVYDIDWSDIQVSSGTDGFFWNANATGGAKIRGFELSLHAHPLSRFTATSAFAFQNARMNQDEPALGAVAGERLPNVPRFTASLSADYVLLENRLRPKLGMAARYVDARWASFDNSLGFPQYHLPDYALVDLRAQGRLGPVDVQLYARNVLNKVGELSATTFLGPAEVAVTQPRTIGMTATVRF